MTIQLPQEVELSIEAAVHRGRFRSVNDAMDKAARLLLRELALELEQERQEEKTNQAASPTPENALRKPIWERAAELRESIPAEEWAKLPVDGASQHDHYIYGTPKRPTL